MLLAACIPESKSIPPLSVTPEGPVAQPEVKKSTEPYDFKAILTQNGIPIGDAPLTVGAPLSCVGETKTPQDSPVTYKIKWTARWKRFGFADWLTSDVTTVMSGGTVTAALAHLEIGCQILAISETLDEKWSEISTFTKVTNSDPAIFKATVVGRRTSLVAGDAGLDLGSDTNFQLVGDNLSCSGLTVDLDNDALSYGMTWDYKVNDSEGWSALASEANHTVPPNKVGMSSRCTIVAYDSSGGIQTSHSSAVLIGNRPPAPFVSAMQEVKSFSLTPVTNQSAIKVGDSLSCKAEASDPDQTARPDMSYEWISSPNADMTDGLVIGTDQTIKLPPAGAHLMLACRGIAKDLNGGITRSSFVAFDVKNTAPPAFPSTLAANGTPSTGKTLTCNSFPTDLDQDSVTRSYQWLISSQGQETSLANTLSTLVVTPDMALKSVRCLTTANDSHGGITVSSPSTLMTISNSSPIASKATVTVTGDSKVGSKFKCSSEVTDPDGDPFTLEYRWFKAEADGGGTVSVVQSDMDPALPATVESKDQEILITPNLSHLYIRCQVSVVDSNLGSGTSEPSDFVLVQNSPPAAFVVSNTGTQNPLYVNGDYACDGSTSDADGDTIIYKRSWRAQSILINGDLDGSKPDIRSLLGTTAPAESVTRFKIPVKLAHKAIDCKMTADDGHENGMITAPTSGQTNVENSKPIIAALSHGDPINVLADTKIKCLSTASDLDGDPVALTVRWLKGADEASANEDYQIPKNSVGNQYYCLRTATDGRNDADESRSALVSVINSPPESFTALLSSADAVTVVGSAVTCSGSTFDNDDELGRPTLSYSASFLIKLNDGFYQNVAGSFTQDGPTSTSPFRASYVLQKNEAHGTVVCTLTAKDASGAATTTGRSDPIVVENSAPSSFESSITSDPEVFVDSTVSCSASTTPTDADGDELTYKFYWFKSLGVGQNFSRISGLTGKIVTVPNYYAHGLMRCAAVASDGIAETVASLSSSLSILNSAPEKALSKVVRISQPETAVTLGLDSEFGYASKLECVVVGTPSDKDLDQVTVIGYEWGTTDSGDVYTKIDGLDTATIDITDVTRRVLAHKSVTCKITMKDQAAVGESWASKETTGDPGVRAIYVNASPSSFVETIALGTSPSYADSLQGKTVVMTTTVVGSVMICGVDAAPIDPDNGGLTGVDLIDIVGVKHTMSHQAFGGWLTLSNFVVPKSAAHKFVRCEGVASDGRGGETQASNNPEKQVGNTPPIVTRSPGVDNPFNLPENSVKQLSGALDVMDPDGDTLTWATTGTPSGAAWASKSRVVTGSASDGYFEIQTTPHDSSDGYDYASLTTPITTDRATVGVQFTDGTGSSAGKISYTVTNVDRPSVVTGYTVYRTYPGKDKTYGVGDPLILSEYQTQSVSTTTNQEIGCAASPDESQELYTGIQDEITGNGELTPTLSPMSPATIVDYKKEAALLRIRVNYTDPDGDLLELSAGSGSGFTDRGTDLDPAAPPTSPAVHQLTNNPNDNSEVIFKVSSCDFVPHSARYTNRNPDGTPTRYHEKADGSNPSGHDRRRWSRPIDITLGYRAPGGAVYGHLTVPATVLDADRRPGVQWSVGSSASPESLNTVAAGYNHVVSEPYYPIVAWKLSKDPDGDSIDAFEESGAGSNAALPNYGCYESLGRITRSSIFAPTWGSTGAICGITNTNIIKPADAQSVTLSTSWEDYVYIYGGGYYTINSGDSNALRTDRPIVKAFNLTRSICENKSSDFVMRDGFSEPFWLFADLIQENWFMQILNDGFPTDATQLDSDRYDYLSTRIYDMRRDIFPYDWNNGQMGSGAPQDKELNCLAVTESLRHSITFLPDNAFIFAQLRSSFLYGPIDGDIDKMNTFTGPGATTDTVVGGSGIAAAVKNVPIAVCNGYALNEIKDATKCGSISFSAGLPIGDPQNSYTQDITCEGPYVRLSVNKPQVGAGLYNNFSLLFITDGSYNGLPDCYSYHQYSCSCSVYSYH